jgi:hypothetical protein
MAARAKENPTRSRQLSISEIIHEASEDMESLAEMVVLQRRVIDDLQTKLDAGKETKANDHTSGGDILPGAVDDRRQADRRRGRRIKTPIA